ncbi:MAG TPA: ABC transporter ATP-binding protein [Aggregatilinea sp.]|jgi:oligopeptide/dipeptide ABC transporter ATP-binding protein|uniref:ABC transporter ATP-binding protein n=1 Tax=Aggregatilinea sp. TaxID=2806333 RepID=UPI002CAAD3E5|nr:ABC transporter ATP-binding protein [Aggregatilinea sp.]HML20562.1 ABC transporter ATP-binding protein [Aggregatilinea sp.]
MNPDHILEIDNMQVTFRTLDGLVRGVDGVSFHVRPGETLGLVGESGCGKSVTAHSIMRLLPKRTAKISRGAIRFRRRNGDVVDLTTVDPEGSLIRAIRGNEIAMIFQEPMTSLSPMHTIGEQIIEAITLHQNVSGKDAEDRAVEMLEAVRIGNARQFIRSYPHQYSGGMRQRAMIAMALSCNPSVLIADEPTTALDVTIQAQILDLMRRLQDEFESAIIMITHNLGVINEVADRVAVMYLGKIVEVADRRTLFKRPAHPYTVGLMQSVPELGRKDRQRLHPIPGMIPDPFNVPKGCSFHPRCPVAKPSCSSIDEVPLVEVEPGHFVRCTLYSDGVAGHD